MLRKAVIVAGGAGTRLSVVEPECPKVLVEIAGEPILARHLRWLARQDVEEVIITVGHRAEEIESWLAEHAPRSPRCTVVHESTPLGTAGGLLNAAERLDESFVVLYGDVLVEMDLQRLGGFHRQRRAAATLVAHPNSHPHDSDLIRTAEDDRILELLPAANRPKETYANLVSAAMYVLEPGALRHIARGAKQDFVRDVFPAMLRSGENVYAYRTPEYLKDMGTPQRLSAVRRDVAAGIPEALAWTAGRPTVFLDRDGTVNRLRGEIVSEESLELVPGTAGAIRKLNRAGVLTALVTNQPMLAKGRLTPLGLDEIHAKLETLLGRDGAYLDVIRFCPHHPERGFSGEVAELKVSCRCRKPEPGMILRIARELPVDLRRSVMIGDSWRDALAARAAGLPCIGIRGGAGFIGPGGDVSPALMAEDVAAAVELYLDALQAEWHPVGALAS